MTENLLSIQDEAHNSISISRNNIRCPDVLAVKKNAVLNKEKKHGWKMVSEKKTLVDSSIDSPCACIYIAKISEF